MQDEKSLPAPLLILIALLQGLLLLLLHQAVEFTFWPHGEPAWLFAFYSMALVGPVMLLLGLKRGLLLGLAKWILPFTLLVGGLGFYVGSQVAPEEPLRYESLLFAFVPALGIAVFKALIYVQQFISGEAFSYSHLFRWSWRNFLTLALALLFALCVWGLLMLWAFLFKDIGISFFYDVFTKTWFYYPVIAVTYGFGVLIFRRLSNVIDTITRLQQALMKFLLVLLVLVSMLFLGGLLLTGLQPLWNSGGSSLILWMQALMLFFVNAVYQDEAAARPYHRWIHRFIYLGVALLPVYSAISCYGLVLRIEQYGWSLSRCWGFLIWALLALFSLGYLWGIARYRDNWLQQLSRVNVVMGLVVLVAMLMVNSPLLDFRKITVASQVQRLDSGKLSVDELDVYYFRRNLGRAGHLALQDLQTRYAQSNPELVYKIENGYLSSDKRKNRMASKKFLESIKIVSGELPEGLGERLYRSAHENSWDEKNAPSRYLLPLDANSDGVLEYLYVENYKHYRNIQLYYRPGDEWQVQGFSAGYSKETDEDFIRALGAGDYKVVEPKWKDIEIGGARLRVHSP